MKRTTSLACASLVIGSCLALGCGGSNKDQPPAQQPLYGAQPGAAPASTDPNAPAAPYGQQPAPGTAATAPGATPAPGTAAPAANPLVDQAIAMAIKALIMPRAATEAKGMKEDGQVVAGNVQEGGTLTQEFMLMPGKCYTILGQGLPPVAQVDLQLAAKPLVPTLPAAVLAASNTQAPNPSIASGKNCYKNPFPIAAQVVLTVKATKGAGAVGAQVYSK
jgi:hypothetical protein